MFDLRACAYITGWKSIQHLVNIICINLYGEHDVQVINVDGERNDLVVAKHDSGDKGLILIPTST